MPYKDKDQARECMRLYMQRRRAADPEAARERLRAWRKSQKDNGIVHVVSEEERTRNRLKMRAYRRRKGVPEAVRMRDPNHLVIPKNPTTREQVVARSKKSKAHPKRAEWSLKFRLKMYGITKEDYDSMRAVVPGCAICGVLPKHPYGLAVDHDHTTGRVRGLLCRNCNSGLGLFKDNPSSLMAATEYLGAR